jgi:hypothetical protein
MVEQPPAVLVRNPYAEVSPDAVSLLFCTKCGVAYTGAEYGTCLHTPVRTIAWKRPIDRSLVGKRFKSDTHEGRIISLIDSKTYCVQRRELMPPNCTLTFQQYMAAADLVLCDAAEVHDWQILEG